MELDNISRGTVGTVERTTGLEGNRIASREAVRSDCRIGSGSGGYGGGGGGGSVRWEGS